MSNNKRILVFSATYNEIENIRELISGIQKNLTDTSILIIDDNSPDKTQEVIWWPFRSVFESFRDNVAGQASLTNDYKPGDSLVGMVLGPKGIIGATVEAIPEYVGPVPVRKAASEVLWTPFLESMQRSYKLFIDRPVGALATIGNIYGLEIIGLLLKASFGI